MRLILVIRFYPELMNPEGEVDPWILFFLLVCQLNNIGVYFINPLSQSVLDLETFESASLPIRNDQIDLFFKKLEKKGLNPIPEIVCSDSEDIEMFNTLRSSNSLELSNEETDYLKMVDEENKAERIERLKKSLLNKNEIDTKNKENSKEEQDKYDRVKKIRRKQEKIKLIKRIYSNFDIHNFEKKVEDIFNVADFITNSERLRLKDHDAKFRLFFLTQENEEKKLLDKFSSNARLKNDSFWVEKLSAFLELGPVVSKLVEKIINKKIDDGDINFTNFCALVILLKNINKRKNNVKVLSGTVNKFYFALVNKTIHPPSFCENSEQLFLSLQAFFLKLIGAAVTTDFFVNSKKNTKTTAQSIDFSSSEDNVEKFINQLIIYIFDFIFNDSINFEIKLGEKEFQQNKSVESIIIDFHSNFEEILEAHLVDVVGSIQAYGIKKYLKISNISYECEKSTAKIIIKTEDATRVIPFIRSLRFLKEQLKRKSKPLTRRFILWDAACLQTSQGNLNLHLMPFLLQNQQQEGVNCLLVTKKSEDFLKKLELWGVEISEENIFSCEIDALKGSLVKIVESFFYTKVKLDENIRGFFLGIGVTEQIYSSPDSEKFLSIEFVDITKSYLSRLARFSQLEPAVQELSCKIVKRNFSSNDINLENFLALSYLLKMFSLGEGKFLILENLVCQFVTKIKNKTLSLMENQIFKPKKQKNSSLFFVNKSKKYEVEVDPLEELSAVLLESNFSVPASMKTYFNADNLAKFVIFLLKNIFYPILDGDFKVEFFSNFIFEELPVAVKEGEALTLAKERKLEKNLFEIQVGGIFNSKLKKSLEEIKFTLIAYGLQSYFNIEEISSGFSGNKFLLKIKTSADNINFQKTILDLFKFPSTRILMLDYKSLFRGDGQLNEELLPFLLECQLVGIKIYVVSLNKPLLRGQSRKKFEIMILGKIEILKQFGIAIPKERVFIDFLPESSTEAINIKENSIEEIKAQVLAKKQGLFKKILDEITFGSSELFVLESEQVSMQYLSEADSKNSKYKNYRFYGVQFDQTLFWEAELARFVGLEGKLLKLPALVDSDPFLLFDEYFIALFYLLKSASFNSSPETFKKFKQIFEYCLSNERYWKLNENLSLTQKLREFMHSSLLPVNSKPSDQIDFVSFLIRQIFIGIYAKFKFTINISKETFREKYENIKSAKLLYQYFDLIRIIPSDKTNQEILSAFKKISLFFTENLCHLFNIQKVECKNGEFIMEIKNTLAGDLFVKHLSNLPQLERNLKKVVRMGNLVPPLTEADSIRHLTEKNQNDSLQNSSQVSNNTIKNDNNDALEKSGGDHKAITLS